MLTVVTSFPVTVAVVTNARFSADVTETVPVTFPQTIASTTSWYSRHASPAQVTITSNGVVLYNAKIYHGGFAETVIDVGALLTPQLSARVSAAAPDVNALAAALGLVAWTLDPQIANFPGTQANVHLAAVFLPAGKVITNLSVPVTIAGAGMTAAQLGIYDANQNLLANTANNGAAFQATGWIELPLTAPWTAPSAGLYYLASGFAGTTLPTVLNIQQNQAGVATIPGGKYRGVHAQAQGTLPNPAVSQSTYSNVPVIVAR